MSSPSVTMTELDGALGIIPVAFGRIQAFCGVSTSGPLNTPVAYADGDALEAVFGAGPLVEAARFSIEHYGKPVVAVRTDVSTDGTTSDLVTATVLGTCVPTVDGSVKPYDDRDVMVKIITGGTIGSTTIPITYRVSEDGGRSYGPTTALGAAVFILVSDVNVKFLLTGAATFLAGDTFSVRTYAPLWGSSELSDALDALIASKHPWEYVTVLGDATGSDQDAVDGKMTGAAARGKHRWAQVHFRIPQIGEMDADYQIAFDASFSSHTSRYTERYSASAYVVSSVSGRQYERSPAYSVSGIYSVVSEEKDIAKPTLGPVPATQIRDANTNLTLHDEFEQPGLDDLKSTCLRTWENREGAFVNNPRLASPNGSDFVFVQYRRVMNLARAALQSYLEDRTSSDIVVDSKTGFILESEAKDIESGANATLESVLLAGPKASAVSFVLSRTDNILSTQTLTYTVRIVPLGYAKTITGTIGFFNPAIRAIAA